MNNLYFRAARGKAENVRRRLMQLGVFDRSRKIIRENSFIFLPLLKKISLKEGVLTRKTSLRAELKPRSLKEALKGKLSPRELKILPSAFDLIGDIAVLEIPEKLLKRKRIIANALLKTFSNIKVVAAKTSPVSTEFRVRGIRIIAGEKRTVTVHKEYGCLYRLDVASAYFSPRLGAERMRVAGQVKGGERVLVMFAGVGPYAILIAKLRNPREVVAVELNPRAAGFMEENARLNKVNINVIQGDVRSVVPNLGKFDRIVMPLPKDAGYFLDITLPALNKNGVVHLYDFAETPTKAAAKVSEICQGLGYKIKILDSVFCGSYSPKISRICVDFKVIKKNN